MASLEAFHQFIAPLVLGCSTPLIDSAILRASNVLCNEGQIWQDELDADVFANDAECSIPIPSNSNISVVIDVWLDGTKLDPVSKDTLTQDYVDWVATTGTPSKYFLTASKDLRLYPIPEVDGTLMASVSLVPKMTATVLPEFLLDDWYEAISNGALWILLSMPNAAWSNPNLAAYHGNLFSAAKGSARIASMRQFTREQQYVQPRRLI